jgi:hypothetical protein
MRITNDHTGNVQIFVRIALAACLLSAGPMRALAHEGPPYPIIVNKSAGPCVLSVWADPDVGIGTFFIILEPLPVSSIPNDIKVEVAVQPVNGRLAEARYMAARDVSSRRTQFKVETPFDSQGLWKVRILLASSRGAGEAVTEVQVTPPGFGRWDLLIYFFPFLLIGLLWLRRFFRKRAV